MLSEKKEEIKMKIILAALIVFISTIKLSYSLSCMCEGYECPPAVGCTGILDLFQNVQYFSSFIRNSTLKSC